MVNNQSIRLTPTEMRLLALFIRENGRAPPSNGSRKIPPEQTPLPCHRLGANQTWLTLFVLVHNLRNFLRQLTLSDAVRDCSLLSVQLKLVKTGSHLVPHAHRLVFLLPR